MAVLFYGHLMRSSSIGMGIYGTTSGHCTGVGVKMIKASYCAPSHNQPLPLHCGKRNVH
ncbi:MAG: hypothetical protein P0Y53_18760 [Candidatus Pseudobacter hemicellulosilyticus]|uniref:Uncharacterized protein n=1 Tax=Candidatus Pseudobacter hemicellulosilyticus TaxID=3121375 RepID=A0AAJ5WRS7_9BACT|nr:MAG: hypothetical protein P0Y53_18760 [Pseudobacter sp.]